MKLYRTPLGQWCGTQAEARAATLAEGSKRGTWREVNVPTDKPGLLAFLNGSRDAPVEQRQAAPKPREPLAGDRHRIFVNGLFACVINAPDADTAAARARDLVEARQVTAQ